VALHLLTNGLVNSNPVGTNSDTYSSNTGRTEMLLRWYLHQMIRVQIRRQPIPTKLYSDVSTHECSSYRDTTICPGESVPITSVAGGGEGTPYFYSWNNGAGNDSAATVTPVTTTIYQVSATDACGSTPCNR